MHAARCRRDHQASTAQNSRTDSACRTSRPARAAHIRPLACPESYRPIASRLRRQHARAAACCPTFGPCSPAPARLEAQCVWMAAAWVPHHAIVLVLRAEEAEALARMVEARAVAAALGRAALLLHIDHARQAVRRAVQALRARAARCSGRASARGLGRRTGAQGALHPPSVRRKDADAHEPCHCVRWHAMSGGSEWLRPCTQQQHHAAGPAPGAAPPQRCWKATERREAGRGAAPACSRAC